MKIAVFLLVVLPVFLLSASPVLSEPQTDINAKIARIDIDKATLDDVIRVFGEPQKYTWDNQSFTKDKLPERFIAVYPNGFRIFFDHSRIIELRFDSDGCDYVFAGKIRIGSSLDEAIEAIGQPKETLEGKPNERQDGVLYKDIDGQKGRCYYGRKDRGVRFFFADYKVTALFVARSYFGSDDKQPSGKEQTAARQRRGAFQLIKPVDSVKEYDDVRDRDLSKLRPAAVAVVISTLDFNKDTIWPDQNLVPGKRPERLLEEAMNPGLGVRALHSRGITGKGVNVAIIDYALYQDHPEFAGKIVAYHDLADGKKSSMHGPSVTSLLAGNNCGTAPDAKIYYVAARDMCFEVDYAEGLDWIIEQNSKLPQSDKIRVVSVSAAPGISGTPSSDSQKKWSNAVSRAENAGILVLDCTDYHGFIFRCFLNSSNRENPSLCSPDIRPGQKFDSGNDMLFAPSGPRTMAEQYQKDRFTYQYNAKGGQSWAVPYVAGVLAMGWQVNPGLEPEQMKEILFNSVAKGQNGAKIVDPQRFIGMVRTAKVKRVSIY